MKLIIVQARQALWGLKSEVVLVCMYVCDAHDAIAYHVMEVKDSEDRRRQNSPGLYKTVNCSTKE